MITNIEIEKSLLNCLLSDQNAPFKILNILDESDFASEKHKTIFKAILNIFSKGQTISLLTLKENLESSRDLENAGGLLYLADINNEVVLGSHLIDYAKIIKDKSLRRKLLQAQKENEVDIYAEDLEIERVLINSQSRLFQITPLKTKSDDINTILKDLDILQNEYSEKYKSGKALIGFSSGVSKIDDIIDGLRPGHLWVIGGWHGTGKTSFALNIIDSILNQKIPTSIISLEMSQVDLAAKILGIRNLMSSMKVIKGRLDDGVQSRLEESKEFLRNSALEIHSEFDLEKIILQIRKDVYVKKVKVVLIDYIQKITHSKIFDETALASKASKDLSNLAQELGITIILLSQISNEAQKGAGAGAGFKGSGTIEASADFAVVLKRDKEKELPDAEWIDLQIKITKNKFGLDGIINAYFHLKSGKISLTPYEITETAKTFGGEVMPNF